MSDIILPTGKEKIDRRNWGQYRNPGDIYNMNFHDIFGSIIFLIFFILLILLLIFGILKGKPLLLFQSWDENGNYCGIDNHKLINKIHNYNSTRFQLYNFLEYPYLLFSLPRNNGKEYERIGEHQYCVKKCPTLNTFEEAITDSCKDSIRICPSYFNQEQRIQERKKGGKCICPYPTQQILNRCIPILNESIKNHFINFIPGLNQNIISFIKLWLPILLSSFLSIIISFLFIYLLKYFTNFFIYFICFMFPLIFICFGILFYIYNDNNDNNDNNNNKYYYKYIPYIFWCIGIIILLIIVFLIDKLNKTIKIIEISSRATISNIISFFIPFISLILILIFYLIIILSSIFNYTSNDFIIKYKNNKLYLSYLFNDIIKYILIYNFCYFIFITIHLYFINFYSISSSIVYWYFNQNISNICNFKCFYGFYLSFTKSLGTITYSTIIIIPFYLLIIILNFIEQRIKKNSLNISKFIIILMKCLTCCLYIFEKFLRYINRILFTISQIYNSSWYKSIKISSKILFNDILLTISLNGITNFIIFSLKIVTSGINTFFFFLYIKFIIKDFIHDWILSLFIIFILSYLFCSFVFGMLNNIIDIIFVCYQSDIHLTKKGIKREMYINIESKQLIESLKQVEMNKNKEEHSE